jgi:hypothetical protein
VRRQRIDNDGTPIKSADFEKPVESPLYPLSFLYPGVRLVDNLTTVSADMEVCKSEARILTVNRMWLFVTNRVKPGHYRHHELIQRVKVEM